MNLSIKNNYVEYLAAEKMIEEEDKIANNTTSKKFVHFSKKDSDTRTDEEIALDIPFILQISFIVISFGYMLPWTSLGSLISYYKYKYSASFYVKIYCAYYLPGLPVALAQYQFDEYLDIYFGSKKAYLYRGVVCYIIMILTIISLLWVEGEVKLICLFTILGLTSWLIHGTATMYASMFPKACIAYLQIGFRFPELYAVSADFFLDLGQDATVDDLNIFYRITALLVTLSLCCWLWLVNSKTSTALFADKDNRVDDKPYNSEASPLISKESDDNLVDDDLSHLGPINRAKYFIHSIDVYIKRDEVFYSVRSLFFALFISIWCSIFQASFFAYVTSSSDTKDIEQSLYFIRLFCDLLGRPLTFLPRPYFLNSNNSLLVVALWRSVLLIVFFAYILIPSFPKNDWFIYILVGVFSLLSGYLTVLIYEFAASHFVLKSQRAHATNILNMGFQLAAFLAVIMSVTISLSGCVTIAMVHGLFLSSFIYIPGDGISCYRSIYSICQYSRY